MHILLATDAAWIVDADGRHPPLYTVVSVDDVEQGAWRASDPARQEHLVRYVRALEAAIEEGATIVRVGRAIFGARG